MLYIKTGGIMPNPTEEFINSINSLKDKSEIRSIKSLENYSRELGRIKSTIVQEISRKRKIIDDALVDIEQLTRSLGEIQVSEIYLKKRMMVY